jgi:hypothetical protein
VNTINYFDNREECKKFLDRFNFEYYIPYPIDWVAYNRYTVQLNKECTEVLYCSFESVENGLVKDSITFFDIEKLKVRNKEGILVNAFPSAQAGESLRRYVKGRKHI